uniref:Kazal-like domain-containing protein n=1 Tax=Bactrocera dorsalis TaxID=27457 RepID=A0A034V0A4_BACDO
MLTVKVGLCLLLMCCLGNCAESASVAEKKPKPAIVNGPPSVTGKCDLESNCNINETTIPLCRYDDGAGCIRKYASKCHLKIAECVAGMKYTDYSNDYCSMDTFLCEEGYERWTIFFGYEKA